jgi:hypothetical protein
MRLERVRSNVGLAAVFASVLGAFGLDAQTEPPRHHDAHEHGVAHLNVAVDGTALFLEFISPAANIVGFEHSPRDIEQKALVKKAVDTLKDGKSMIVLPAGAQAWLADCNVKTDIDSDETHDEAHDHNGHSEFTVEYHFVCKHPEKLTHIDVMLMRAFPGTERIEVQLLTATKQTALELTPKHNRISF